MIKVDISFVLSVIFCSFVTGTCPPGFFHHEQSCYTLLRHPATWSQAMELCEIFGASLATIETEQEDLYLKGVMEKLIASVTTQEVWLGGTDMLNEGEWLWAKSFKKITYTRWGTNEPNNGAGNNQHCLAMKKYQDFKWDDDTCSDQAMPLCERPIDLPWGQVDQSEVLG